jgi:putative transcriptional regulator
VPPGKTDWKRVDALTEEEVHAAALSDPDNPPLTKRELQRMVRVPDVQAIRRKLGMTQVEFATAFHLSVGTIRDWEQGRTWPDQAARTLLRVIEQEPKVVQRALQGKPRTSKRRV